MLDPARFWEVLGKFLLCHTANFAPGVKEDAAVRRRTGVQRHNVLLVSHRNSPLSLYNNGKPIFAFIIQDVHLLCAWQMYQRFVQIFGIGDTKSEKFPL